MVYAVAFASLGVQVAGLVGDTGILPARDYLTLVEHRLGPLAWQRLPTICWLVGAGSATLQVLCATGALCGLALAAGVLPGPAALAAWSLYLSLAGAGQVFLAFQWDALLLETGLLALLVAPWRRRLGSCRPGVLPLLPLWCLVFKLHVLSGWVKLASGDPTWRDLTALEYHYWTTCLPVWVGWYAAQLPDWAQRVACAVMFAIELLAPFAILGPRRLRHAAAAVMIALQIGIATTGNYGFFNLLTIALCITLFDDAALARCLPGRRPDGPVVPLPRRFAVGMLAVAPACVLVLLPMVARVGGAAALPPPVRPLLDTLAPLRSFNAYGLFADMTTVRPEIVVEGSMDGEAWHPLPFRWKPGDPSRRPGFVQPHMPRLDWQMWFAALQGYERTYWFDAFLERLLEGAPAVTALLAGSPSADPRAPRYVRAVLYTYEFATPAEHGRGLWWRRQLLGPYAPPRARQTTP